MKRFILLPLSLALVIACHDQSSRNKSTPTDSTTVDLPGLKKPTAIPAYTGPRFQILQSTIAAKGTFRLDTYTGDISQMQASGKLDVWHPLRRVPALMRGVDSTVDDRPNYHLFLSGIAMRFTFLINTHTGATWELVEDPQTTEDYFSPILER